MCLGSEGILRQKAFLSWVGNFTFAWVGWGISTTKKCQEF